MNKNILSVVIGTIGTMFWLLILKMILLKLIYNSHIIQGLFLILMFILSLVSTFYSYKDNNWAKITVHILMGLGLLTLIFLFTTPI